MGKQGNAGQTEHRVNQQSNNPLYEGTGQCRAEQGSAENLNMEQNRDNSGSVLKSIQNQGPGTGRDNTGKNRNRNKGRINNQEH